MSENLRRDSARELKENIDQYLNHPHLEKCSSDLAIPKEVLLHSILGHDSITICQERGMKAAVQNEAEQSFIPKRWGTLLNMFSLSTVLGKDIVSVYPDVPFAHRQLVHGIIQPLRAVRVHELYTACHKHPIVLLCTRDGDFVKSIGAMFEPNHIVPIVTIYPKKRQASHVG